MTGKLKVLIFLFSITLTTLSGQKLMTNMDSVSYSFGVLMAQSLKSQGVDTLHSASFAKAIEHVFAGSDLEISIEEANQHVQKFMSAQQAKQYEGVMKEGKEFLAENGKRAEVTTTASGLQYEVLVKGEGPVPTAESKVTVHYTGKLIDGKVFDSSVERGQPATFGVTQVIGGWTEALQLMNTGSTYRLYIPQDLAYGDRGAGNDIPPYATLVFDVELISIQ